MPSIVTLHLKPGEPNEISAGADFFYTVTELLAGLVL